MDGDEVMQKDAGLPSRNCCMNTTDIPTDRTADESQSFCLAASSFFIDNLDSIKKCISAQLVGSSYDPPASGLRLYFQYLHTETVFRYFLGCYL